MVDDHRKVPDTREQLKERLGDPLTMSVPDAGYKYYGLGRNASYEAVKAGHIPVIRVLNRLRVPITAMEQKLVVYEGGEA